jgi:CheY-like chemotaxis protein/two-component sensor histidine kinase
LDFSKIEAGKLALEQMDLDLMELTEEVVELFVHRAESKRLKLSCSIAPNLPMFVGDPTRIRQIVTNLIANALKFTQDGSVSVSVKVGEEFDSKQDVFISIRDTGIGIAPDRIGSVFASFTQADGSTTRRYGGTGLGLTICRQLADLMDGSISVESKLGEGSTFTVRLRLKKSSVPRSAIAQVDLHGLKILLLQPNEDERAKLTEHLASWDCLVSPLAHPTEALNLLSNGYRPDFAIVDHQMREMDGATFARKAVAILPKLPIILMTTLWDREALLRDETDLFSGLLVKPIRHRYLLQALTIRAIQSEGIKVAERAAEPPLRGVRVLLAEDNQINQKIARQVLANAGCSVDTVETGKEVCEQLDREQYDVILMDCQMPIMDGLEATRLIRASDHAWRSIPIIAVTANAMAGDREQCLEAGMDDYISKPIKPAQLVETLILYVRPPALRNVA